MERGNHGSARRVLSSVPAPPWEHERRRHRCQVRTRTNSVSKASRIASSSNSSRAIVSASRAAAARSEEHTSELQSLMRISYAVFCLKKKKTHTSNTHNTICQHINTQN